MTNPKEYPNCKHFWCPRDAHGTKILEFNCCHGHEPWSCRRTQKEGKCRMEKGEEPFTSDFVEQEWGEVLRGLGDKSDDYTGVKAPPQNNPEV